MNSYLKFGKYRDLTYAEVLLKDPDYCDWCCSMSDCSSAMQKLKDYCESFKSGWGVGYHLLLDDSCHYIGTTQNWPERIADHMRGAGAAWTQMHSVIKVVSTCKITDPKTWEKLKTLETMAEYGWENVRGYCWCQRFLKAPPRLLKMYD